MATTYKHEPFTDFSKEENRRTMEAALSQAEATLGLDYPLIIGGERITTEEKLVSVNPANKEEIIGNVSKANQALADQAMDAALEAFESWRKWDPAARVEILFRAAAILRRRKHEFSALLVKEAGKPWKEADADTAEAIDFMEYYARQMLELKDGKPVNSREGELNSYIYTPTGVSVVIPPWNFACAIMVEPQSLPWLPETPCC